MTASKTLSPDLEALRLLQAGRIAEALPFARRAVEASRVCSPAHGLLATVLLRLGDRNEAEAVIARALNSPPGSGDAYDALAFVSLQLGEHQRANVLYHRATERAPNEARFWYNLAASERSFGRFVEAEAACDQAIAIDPSHYQSYLLRSELRPQTDADNHIEAMERLLGEPAANDRARIFLGYALGKELDDLRQYDRAFAWFSRAATARRRHLSYDVATDERKMSRIIEVYAEARPYDEALREPTTRFVFIMGLPRSGTTLAERILMRLPGVRSNGETENFSQALLSAAPATDSDVFARCAAADPGTVGERYCTLAGGGDAIRLIEKLPLNYLYVGAMQRTLPGSTPIALARSPIDVCFAMYRTLFGAAYPFSYDFGELARYYAAYDRLIGHWRRLFGKWLVEIRYEDLVEEPVRTGMAMATACGLPWSNEAIEIEKNTAVSTTASASQVRQPIYRSSVGRWRNYREQLSPLVDALRAAGVSGLGTDA
ncbi:MAG TPA: sulfotransferase [Candidatus Acidoferrum sp.]|nr:sulfotransferase [Candidatus Acidoferrum sp.]